MEPEISMKISDKEFSLISELISARSGIKLGYNKAELVKARLADRVHHFNFRTFKEYYEYVINDKTSNELVEMLDAISTNVTSFFREKHHFEFMVKRALPEIIAKKRAARSNRIRIWSAACSSGEEVYTILMTIYEYLDNPGEWDIKVLGSDISTRALAAAKEGRYNLLQVKGIPPPLLEKYFTVSIVNGKRTYTVKPDIRKRAYFMRINLMDQVFPFRDQLDIIFCRNVMIYFDKSIQEQLINKFYKCLDNNGYLFIGHSDSLIGMKVDFKAVEPASLKKAR